MNLLYTILYVIVLILVFPFEYFKRTKGSRRIWLAEKLGNTGAVDKKNKPVIWIHAVSVGEVLAAVPIIQKLKESGYGSIVLSTTTDTGRQMALEKAPKGMKVIYLPFDVKMLLNRAIKSLAPDVFMTMETELWPNLFTAMNKARVTSFIFNGRISDRSFPRYKKITFFLKKVFASIEAVGMQSSQDAERIWAMGMEPRKIHVTGNFKFDVQGALTAPEWTRLLRGLTIVAGSTHEGEEEIILDAYLRLKQDHQPINLILAPRHPKRFSNVENILKEKGIRYIKRSEIPPPAGSRHDPAPPGLAGLPGEIQNTVVLVDTLGELAGIYAAADICIIGGSFVPVGGHNLFEAAFWSKPIVCGPHMNNFPLVGEFLRNNAARIAKSTEVYDIVVDLLLSEENRMVLGNNAHRIFRENSGAVDKAMAILIPYLKRGAQ
ncbi:MAG: 3-deoxy-D-manno-octulosonic acid transferase [bacterium]